MRRILVSVGAAAGLLLVASPAEAFAHSAVHNAYLHALLDVLTLVVVASPALSIAMWGPRRRGLLLALVAVVQLPVAVIGFVPIVNPILHITASTTALGLTAGSLYAVRRLSRTTPAIATAPTAD